MKKILFKGFWPGFDYKLHSAFNWIIEYFGLVVTDESPDIIIYGYPTAGPDTHEKCIKVFFTGECIEPDFSIYDFAFTFENSENRKNFRFPLYLWHHDSYGYLEEREIKDWASTKKKFCNFIYGNSNTNMEGVRDRIDFFKKLSQYKKVDSGGSVLNNIGYRVDDKKKWIQDYKFTISFENQYSKGYTTEKIIDPFLCGSLPIYKGNPLIYDDFNKGSFIHVNDFENIDEVISSIINLDNNDDLYNQMMNTRIIPHPRPIWSTREWYIECWKKILEN